MHLLEQESTELLLFVYGLSFFSLGLSVLFARPRESEYFFASKIWLLAFFAISHALEDWISLFKYMHSNINHTSLNYVQSILLLSSYLFLFEFSRYIIRTHFLMIRQKKKFQKHIIYEIYNPFAIYTLASMGLLYLVYLHPSIDGINAAIRYTYGFWGSFLLGGGLYYYGESLNQSENINKLKLYFKIAGGAFAAYAIFSGIVVNQVSYFPGNYINTQTFVDNFHIHVEALRGLCALIITIASIKTLSIFKYELMEKLHESYENTKKFSSNASHQIKTPLTALRLQIHVALKKNKKIQEYQNTLSSIDNEIVYLQDMVNNMLLLTRINNMNIKESFKIVEVDGIVLNNFEQYSIIAKNKGVLLDIRMLDYLKTKAEPTLLNILISNLIDNAIKFTPKGGKVTISLAKKIFTIIDSGIGIEKDKLPMVFDEFYRINQLGKEHIKGYGLGLSMVKKIVDIYKAKMEIVSKIDLGTTISIEFKTLF